MTTFTVDEIQSMLDKSPFIKALQMQAVAWAPDETPQRLVLRMPMTDLAERQAGARQMHGGPIASLIDTAGCFAVGLALGGRGLPTIAFSTNYLRPVVDTTATATALVRRIGKSVGIADVDVVNDDGVLVAIGRTEYSTRQG
ncbi:MAG: PaaI family thioesterase [Pseudomonadota bacterium]